MNEKSPIPLATVACLNSFTFILFYEKPTRTGHGASWRHISFLLQAALQPFFPLASSVVGFVVGALKMAEPSPRTPKTPKRRGSKVYVADLSGCDESLLAELSQSPAPWTHAQLYSARAGRDPNPPPQLFIVAHMASYRRFIPDLRVRHASSPAV